jgi:hypothetical protein
MTLYVPQAKIHSGGATHHLYTNAGSYYQVQWNPTTNRIPHPSSAWGVTMSVGSTITLSSGRSYYLFARPNVGGTAAGTSAKFAFHDTTSGAQYGTEGRVYTGQSSRSLTSLYSKGAAAIIIPSDFSGATLSLELRLTVLSGGLNTSVVPTNNDTAAQGIGSIIIYATA